jgi:outer membrane lipoprotein-sorting protein
MIRRVIALVFSIALLFTINASAQTVDEIIAKHVQARGGLEKIKAVKSAKTTGKLVMQGLEIPVTIQQKRANKLRLDATFQGKSLVQAYDGAVAWKIDPFQGTSEPEKMAGEEEKQTVEQSDMDGALIDYKEKGHTVELVGKEDVEGTPVYHLKLTKKSGDISHIYIDAENYLEIKSTAKRKTPGGEMEIETFYGNYKPVNGLVYPFSIEAKVGGQVVQNVVVDKMELDLAIEDSFFKMPVKEEKPKTTKP